ncbi:MAG: hypothetical protein DI529_10690 [Chryseobacterium sp.]|nr:MAG: hypothetical protein DI529_10690 [Chryseobacterium sp.]
MKKILFLIICCFPLFVFCQSWQQLGQTISDPAPSIRYVNEGPQSMSKDGKVIATSYIYNNSGTAYYDGFVQVYQYDGNSWQQLGSNINFPFTYALISLSLSEDGKTVAVGYESTDDLIYGIVSAGIRIYEYHENNWEQVKEFNYNEVEILSISLSNDANTLAITNWEQNINGTVKIYRKTGNDWSSIGTLTGEESGEFFGYSTKLSSDGNTIIAGAPFSKGGGGLLSNPGAAYVYNYNGTSWQRIGQRIDGDNFQYSLLGSNVDISLDGKTVAVGISNSMSPAGSGYMRTYRLDGNTWKKLGNDFTNDVSNITSFGLNGNGNIIAVGKYGATNTDGNVGVGVTQIYQYICSNWVLTDENKIYGSAQYDRQGLQVNVNNDGKMVALGGRGGTLNINTATKFIKVYSRDNILPSSIQVSTANQQSTIIEAGQYLQLKTCIYPSYSYQDIVWSVSSGSDKASVDQTGLVYGIQPGVVTVRASSLQSGDIYGEIGIIIKENLSISENTNEEFIIYPNPTESLLYISNSKNTKLLELLSVDGRLLLKSSETKLNLNYFPKGNYILKIIKNNGEIISKKVIKK